MNPFQEYVQDNIRWFRGPGQETDESLRIAEDKLGIRLPADVRWLLRTYGYWHATGISSLDETVKDTLDAREHLGLPARYVVLYNHHDGGVALLDTEPDYQVFEVGWELVPDHLHEDIVYPSYLEYVCQCLENARQHIDEDSIDYDAESHRGDAS